MRCMAFILLSLIRPGGAHVYDCSPVVRRRYRSDCDALNVCRLRPRDRSIGRAHYEALAEIAPSPVVALNRAVAIGLAAAGPANGLAALDGVDASALGGYHLLPGRARRLPPPPRPMGGGGGGVPPRARPRGQRAGAALPRGPARRVRGRRGERVTNDGVRDAQLPRYCRRRDSSKAWTGHAWATSAGWT